MNYLVDSNVLSEPTKPAADPAVVAWLERHAPEVAVDPIILGEIRFGISTTPAGKHRRDLERWFDQGVTNIACLAWDAASGLRWADLLSFIRCEGAGWRVDPLVRRCFVEGPPRES